MARNPYGILTMRQLNANITLEYQATLCIMHT
jgi:hypothetical protein